MQGPRNRATPKNRRTAALHITTKAFRKKFQKNELPVGRNHGGTILAFLGLAFLGSAKGFRYSFADAPTEWLSTMRKRTFLKLAGAVGAEAILSPVARLGAKSKVPDKLKNWAGNIEYSTE